MCDQRLKVNFVEKKSSFPSSAALGGKSSRRQETQARMERLWHQDVQQFNPERDCMQRQRVQRTIEALRTRTSLTGLKAVDLGCGGGVISRLLRDGGAAIDAVDVATNALQLLKSADMQHITPIHDCLPNTRLADNAYDLVVCTEVIGYLPADEYRLLFAELARLVKADGLVACSTGLDIDTDDALERFAALGETEFIIDQWVLSYHRLFIQLLRLLEAPAAFVKASQSRDVRQQELAKRAYFSRFWFKWNSTAVLALCWKIVNLASAPLAAGLRQNKPLLTALERITKFLWSESGISHALFIGRRRPLTFPLPAGEMPREMKHKRQVWE